MKRLALVCLALVSQLGVPTEASAVPDIQGKKCAKVGTYRTVKRVSYTCIKSGRSFVWKATKATTTTTTTPSTAVPDKKCAKVGTYRTVKRVSYTCIKSGRSFVWKATKATTTTTTTPSTAVPDSKQFAFQYNLDKSLPEAWISEFQSIMKNLGETLPINPNINEYVQNNVMNIYAWNSAVKNPFTEKPNMSGACICGDDHRNRWMVLEIYEGEFEYDSPHRYSVIVHEYFHVYQIALSKDSLAPKWLDEGGAKVLEEIYAQQYYGKNSLQNDLNSPDLWSNDVFTNPSLYEQYETSSGEAQTGGWIDMNYAGSAYMLLTLVKELQKQGISEQRAFEMVFRDFWLEKSKQSDWKIAFKQVFKMDVNTFYETLKTQTRNDANKLLPSESLTIQEIFVSK